MTTSRYVYGFLHVLAAATTNAYFYDPELGISTAFLGSSTDTNSNGTTQSLFLNPAQAPYANNSRVSNVAAGVAWTLNVTDVLLPDATTFDGTPIPGAHAIAVSYGYQYRNNGSLSDAIDNSADIGTNQSSTMCATVISTLNRNLSFTPALNDLDTSDGCTSAFGRTCVDAVLSSLKTSDEWFECPALPDLASIPECNNTFGAVGALEFSTFTRSGDDYSDGKPFFVSTTYTLPGNDTTTVQDVANSLQIVVLSAVTKSDTMSSMSSNMLCQRANATYEVPSSTPTPSPTGSSTPRPSSGAASIASQIGWAAVMGAGAALLVL